MEFKTERLFLRPTTTADAKMIFELMNSPKWLDYIGDRNVKTREAAVTYIEEKIIAQQERLGYANFTLHRIEDGAKLGSCGLYDRPGLEGVDIGFALLPQFEGVGYGREAATCILEQAKTTFKIKSLNAITLPRNMPSRRLLEHLGLTLIKEFTLPEDSEVLLLYRIDF